MILFQKPNTHPQVTHNERIYYDPELISGAVVEKAFDIEYWQSQNNVFGSAQGRGTTWFLQLEAVPAALRHYRRGGLFGKLISDHFLFSSWESTRCYQEYKILEHLTKQGVNVPKPVAIRTIKKQFFYQADIITQFIPNSSDLVSLLKNAKLDVATYRNIGQQVRNMHDAHVNHTDLNIHNILLDEQGKVWIIDFDKCKIEKTQIAKKPLGQESNVEAWTCNNLERLLRSFNKELNKHNIHWNNEDWQFILEGYSN